MSSSPASLFSDWLQALGVRHTCVYSDRQYARMPFRTLFGLSKLLQSYGVDARGYAIADKGEIAELKPPFVAQTQTGDMVIVERVGPDSVSYTTQGKREQARLDDFTDAWTGIVLLAEAGPQACEPGYRRHRFLEIMTRLRDAGVWIALAAVFGYMFVAHGLEGRWYTVALTLLDTAGLALSFMLVQKTAGVHTRMSDTVCGVLQEGGCDKILATGASTFLGIFHWSEVGLAYFGVSLLTLLLYPDRIHDLALINACCLPYTVWSITYQRFVAHHWCTLCVGVQATLWLLFFCYLFGGSFSGAWPPHISFFALGAVYVAALLVLSKYSNLIKYLHDDNDSDTGSAETD